jgi:hypothetical protein
MRRTAWRAMLVLTVFAPPVFSLESIEAPPKRLSVEGLPPLPDLPMPGSDTGGKGRINEKVRSHVLPHAIEEDASRSNTTDPMSPQPLVYGNSSPEQLVF